MSYLFVFIWTVLDIGFVYTFVTSFLEAKRDKKEIAVLLAATCLSCAAFDALILDGLSRYLMYLLAVVIILLGIFDEYGIKGLCLLFFSFLIPFAADHIISSVIPDRDGTVYCVTQTIVKCVIALLSCLLKKYRHRDRRSGISEDSETLLLRQHMEMQQESMTALEQNYRLQRKSTHEFEHHLQVLRDLLGSGEAEAAKNYLDRLKRNRAIHTISVSSGHPVVDVILNQKHQSAGQNEIKMQIQVNDLSNMQIPTEDLVVVLTNLLDNAIEACRRIDGYREIFCTVLYDDGLYISIRNTSLSVTVTDGKIPTSKQDSLSHGFGLLSVSYVLDKLGAEYTFGYEEGWFHFTAEIEV